MKVLKEWDQFKMVTHCFDHLLKVKNNSGECSLYTLGLGGNVLINGVAKGDAIVVQVYQPVINGTTIRELTKIFSNGEKIYG